MLYEGAFYLLISITTIILLLPYVNLNMVAKDLVSQYLLSDSEYRIEFSDYVYLSLLPKIKLKIGHVKIYNDKNSFELNLQDIEGNLLLSSLRSKEIRFSQLKVSSLVSSYEGYRLDLSSLIFRNENINYHLEAGGSLNDSAVSLVADADLSMGLDDIKADLDLSFVSTHAKVQVLGGNYRDGLKFKTKVSSDNIHDITGFWGYSYRSGKYGFEGEGDYIFNSSGGVISLNDFSAYFTSLSGHVARASSKHVVWDFSGQKTYGVVKAQGYKGGNATIKILEGGGYHNKQIYDTDLNLKDLDEVMSMIDLPKHSLHYHSGKVKGKAVVELIYDDKKRAGVNVHSTGLKYSSLLKNEGELRGLFSFAFFSGTMTVDVNVNDEVSKNKFSLVGGQYDFTSPITFHLKGNGQSFNNILRLFNYNFDKKLTKWDSDSLLSIYSDYLLIEKIHLVSEYGSSFLRTNGKLYVDYDLKKVKGNFTSNLNKIYNFKADITEDNKQNILFSLRSLVHNLRIKHSNPDIRELLTFLKLNLFVNAKLDAKKLDKLYINNFSGNFTSPSLGYVRIKSKGLFYTLKNGILNGKVNLVSKRVNASMELNSSKNKLGGKLSLSGKDWHDIYNIKDFRTQRWSLETGFIVDNKFNNLQLYDLKGKIQPLNYKLVSVLGSADLDLRKGELKGDLDLSNNQDVHLKIFADSSSSDIKNMKINLYGKDIYKFLLLDKKAGDKVLAWNLFFEAKGDYSELNVRNLKFKLGRSDLKGGGKFLNKALPQYEFRVSSDSIVLDEIIKIVKAFKKRYVADNKINEVLSKIVSDNQSSAKPQPKKRYFSQEPIDLSFLHKNKVIVNWKVKGISYNTTKLKEIGLLFYLDNIGITFDASLGDLKEKSTINIFLGDYDTKKAKFPLDVNMALRELPLDEIVKLFVDDELIKGGKIVGKVALSMEGNSVGGLLESLDGDVDIQTSEGYIGSTMLNVLSTDLLALPKSILTGGSKYRKIYCSHLSLLFKDGIMNSDSGFIVNGEDFLLKISTMVNFTDDSLNILVEPYSKGGIGISLSNQVGSYLIKGSFDNLSTGKSLKDILWISAKGFGAYLTSGLSLVMDALIQKIITSKGNYCKT